MTRTDVPFLERASEMASDHPLSGSILGGRYRLLSLLGRGGTSLVFAAEHLAVGRPCAIKILHPELMLKDSVVRRFCLEAKRMGAVVHENVISVFDFDVDRGSPFLVMERLAGQTLRELLRHEGRLPWPRAVDLARQLCAGAQAAHALGLVHRDLKPENVFITRRADGSECAKILDFGVAKAMYAEESVPSTQPGTLLGTTRYMAPEQLQNPKAVDARADMYAIGMVLYEMLAGRPAFRAAEIHAVMQQVLFERPDPLAQLVPEVPREIVACVERATAREPARRFASAAECGAALRAGEISKFVRSSSEVTAQEEEPLVASVTRPRRFRLPSLPPMDGPSIVASAGRPDRPSLGEVVRRSAGVIYVSLPLILATALAGLVVAGLFGAFR